MLDVHAPEHTPHTLRDFFLHIFTITIGLLIALGLEAAVEWRHHAHLRDEAEVNIRSEIYDNQHELAEVLQRVPTERAMLEKVLVFLKAHAENKTADIHNINLGLSLGSYRDSSWQTASATGALGYMEYGHVKKYSEAYSLQAQFTQLQNQTLAAYLQMQSYIVGQQDPTKLSAEETGKARSDVQKALADLIAVQQIGQALQKQYQESSKPE